MKKNIDHNKHPYTIKDINPVNCICCSKEIHALYEDELHINTPESSLWDSGIVNKNSAGYGSCCDGDMYLLAICDECIKIKRSEGSLIYLYDYMSGYNSEERRNKYNVKLHRKIKLKRILRDK